MFSKIILTCNLLAKELKEAANVTISVIKGLVSQGAVSELETVLRDIPYAELDPCLPSKKAHICPKG